VWILRGGWVGRSALLLLVALVNTLSPWQRRTSSVVRQSPVASVIMSESTSDLAAAQRHTLGSYASSNSTYTRAINADHPISYWRLADFTGTTAVDEEGRNPGIIEPGVLLHQPGPIPGSEAMSFDGSRGFVDLSRSPNAPSLQPANTLTVEAWVQTTSSSNNVVFRSRLYGYGLYYNGGFPATYVGSTSPSPGYSFTSHTSVSDGRWHYLVLTKDLVGIDIFVDGKLAASQANSTPVYYQGTGIAIGRDGDCTCSYFDGRIAEVAVYDHALTADQVANHYKVANGNNPSPSPTPSSPADCRLRNPGAVSPTPKTSGGDQYTVCGTSDATFAPATHDVGLRCNNCASRLTLPFPVTLYNRRFTSAFISADGQVDFQPASDQADGVDSVDGLPDRRANTAIFAHWDHLSITGPGDGIFTSIGADRATGHHAFTIEWRATYVDNGASADFAVRLYEGSPRFDIIFGQVSETGSFATVGVQDRAGASFTQYESAQPDSLLPGLELTFQPAAQSQ